MMIVALIPARGGSERVPNKNMAMVEGRHLITYSIEVALNTPEIEKVFVSSDSSEILQHSSNHTSMIIARPPELAQADSTDYDVVNHFLGVMDAMKTEIDYIVYLRPTTPIRTPMLLSKIINKARDRTLISSLRTVEEMSESAYKCLTMMGESEGYLGGLGDDDVEDAGLPNQIMPRTLHPNGYCDIVIPAYINKHKLLWGANCYGYLTPKSIEVDTPEDLEYLRWYIEDRDRE